MLQQDQSPSKNCHQSSSSQCSRSRPTHLDCTLHNQSCSCSPLPPPRHCSRSCLGYTGDHSHECNSSHTTINNDEHLDFSPHQHPLSRDVSCHGHNFPALAPQDTHTGRSQGRRLHHRSSSVMHWQRRVQRVSDSDDNSPLTKQKRGLTSSMSSRTSKRARTLVTTD